MSTNNTTNTNTPGGNAKGRRIFIGIVAVAVVAVIAVFGIRNMSENVGSDDVVIIGAILPLTGKFAGAGNGVRVGLEFAIRELNAKGSVSYKIEYYDTQSEAKNALAGYSRMKNLNKVKFFITNTSDHSLIIKPDAIKNGSLLFCITPHVDITKENQQLVFRCTNTSEDDVITQVEYINNTLRAKRIFHYTMNTEAGLDYDKFYKKHLGANFIGTCVYEEDVGTLRNIATVNTYKKADCILINGNTPALGFLIRILREGGYVGSIIANSTFNQPSIIAAAGDYARTVSFSDYDFPYRSIQHKIWNEKSLVTYQSSFTLMSYHSYGIIRIFDKIYSTGIHSPREIGKQLSETKNYEIKAGEEVLVFTTKDGGISPRLHMSTFSDNN